MAWFDSKFRSSLVHSLLKLNSSSSQVRTLRPRSLRSPHFLCCNIPCCVCALYSATTIRIKNLGHLKRLKLEVTCRPILYFFLLVIFYFFIRLFFAARTSHVLPPPADRRTNDSPMRSGVFVSALFRGGGPHTQDGGRAKGNGHAHFEGGTPHHWWLLPPHEQMKIFSALFRGCARNSIRKSRPVRVARG